MMCQNCGQYEAQVHYEQNINGEKTEKSLCHNCAKQIGMAFDTVSIADFLSGFLNVQNLGEQEANKSVASDSNNLKCDKCGMTFHEINKYKKAGCVRCYDVFKPHFEAIIKSVQAGNVLHKGKFPGNLTDSGVFEINRYREQLTNAVKIEDFEEAARLRDLIREREKERR